MEKDQVTFAVRAVHLTGVVGAPIFMMNFVTDSVTRELVLLVGSFGEVAEQVRLALPKVPLSGRDLEIVNAHISNHVARALSRSVGIKTEIDADFGP